MSEFIPLARSDRYRSEGYPRMEPLDITTRDKAMAFARRIGMFPEQEWGFPLLAQRAIMLSSSQPALFYEPLSAFEQVWEVSLLGHVLGGQGLDGPHVGVGFRYFDSFYRTTTGQLELPGPGERLRGRHWIGIGAPLDADQLFFANTWGSEWGDQGVGYLGREYFEAHVTGATVQWRSDIGHSPRMLACLAALRPDGPSEEDWIACWPIPNEFWVDRLLVDGAPHSMVCWGVSSFENFQPVFVCELRDAGQVLARLHLHSPVEEGGAFSIRELFVAPSHRRRGFGSLLEATAAVRVIELGGGEIEAWIQKPDDLPRTAPASHGFALANGYRAEAFSHPHLDVTTIARKELCP